MRSVLLVFLAGLTGCGVGIWYPVGADGNLMTEPGKLTLTVSVAAVRLGDRATFKATGGKPPYKFAMVSGGGSVTQTEGIFVGAIPAGVSIVRVTDAAEKVAEAAIIVESR